MRVTGISVGLRGFFGFLNKNPNDGAKNARSQGFKSAMRGDRHAKRRLLTIEPLEAREMLSSDSFTTSVNSIWFATVSSEASTHAGNSSLVAESTDGSTSSSSTTTDTNVYDWIVQFNTNYLDNVQNVADVANLLTSGTCDFEVLRGLGLVGQVVIRTSGASTDAVSHWFSSISAVASFEQDSVQQFDTTASNDSLSSQQSYLSQINASSAWTVTTGSSSIVVGIVDTGIDYTHSDLAANMWVNTKEIAGNGVDDDGDGFVDDVYGWNFVSNTANVMDDNGHGTHVAGTIAAVGNNSLGVSGVAWSCSLMALKFLDSTGNGYISNAIAAVNYATMMKTKYDVNIKVLNNSWGGSETSAQLSAAIDACNSAGILFVAAAGNSATNNDSTAMYPANYNAANVISVAAVTSSNTLASFSNYGSSTVDLAAPGVSIYSTLPGNRYGAYSGTSMATPQVSGAAVLAWALNPNATVAEVKAAILNGVTKTSSLSGKCVSGGVLNTYNTLMIIKSQMNTAPTVGLLSTSSSTVSQGSSVTLTASSITGSTASAVYFYYDSNGNGSWDSADAVIGSTTSVSNGTATCKFDTASVTAGSFKVFARAANADGKWSAAVSTSLTVSASDDFGNSMSDAATILIGSTTSGSIQTGGDQDWFKVALVAGQKYTFSTTLIKLTDSVLYLYDSSGKILASSDNVSASSKASLITFTATSSGTYYLMVGGKTSSLTGTYAITAKAENTAPTVASISDQTFSGSQTKITVPIVASDAEGDSLKISASVAAVDATVQLAYNLDQSLGFSLYKNSTYTNLHGLQEKYVVSSSGAWYYITSAGSLYRWGGSVASSKLVATLNSSYYSNPSLLYNATTPTATTTNNSGLTVSVSNGVLTITRTAAFTGPATVTVTVSDGATTTTKTFKVSLGTSTASSVKSASFDESAASAAESVSSSVASPLDVAGRAVSTARAASFSHETSFNSTSFLVSNRGATQYDSSALFSPFTNAALKDAAASAADAVDSFSAESLRIHEIHFSEAAENEVAKLTKTASLESGLGEVFSGQFDTKMEAFDAILKLFDVGK